MLKVVKKLKNINIKCKKKIDISIIYKWNETSIWTDD